MTRVGCPPAIDPPRSPQTGGMPPSRFVETIVDALLALAAFALTGLVATVAILWLVPLLLAAAIAASLGDA